MKNTLDKEIIDLPEAIESDVDLSCSFIRDWTGKPFPKQEDMTAHDLCLFIKWGGFYQEFLGYLLAAQNPSYEVALRDAHTKASGETKQLLEKRLKGFQCYINNNHH